MKQTLQTVYVELQRSLCSISFLIASLGVCTVYYLGAWGEIQHASDLLYLFRYSTQASAFSMLIVLFCTVPYSTSFCTDWNSRYIRLCVIRSGYNKYSFAKVLACAVSSGFSIVLGMVLFFLSLAPWVSIVSKTSSNFQIFADTTLGGIFLINGQHIIYFVIYIYLGFLKGALWGVLGLYISTYIPNKFVAIFTPFIVYYLINILTYSFPVWLRLNRISDGLCIIEGTLISLVYATVLFMGLTFVLGLLFVRTSKRRLADG